jgi:hypothetical protein
MNANVKTAIEGVYAIFSTVPKPGWIEGCPCCVERIPTGILVSKPLSSLTPDELTVYASKALLTVGSVNDFLYFLPRILEICIQEPGWWPDIEVVAGRLS